MRITATPETARVDGHVIDYSHPSAVAFAILGNVVILAPCSTHALIFNALKAIAKPESGTPMAQSLLRCLGPQALLRDYGLHCIPALPGPQDLAVFAKCDNELGARRNATQAGRAWTGVTVGGRQVSIISWWVKRSQVPPMIIALVADAIGLSGDCLVEFQDSEAPEAHLINPKPCATEQR